MMFGGVAARLDLRRQERYDMRGRLLVCPWHADGLVADCEKSRRSQRASRLTKASSANLHDYLGRIVAAEEALSM